ncbi:Gfo/Idh/MocA family oxidoreductase [Panacibacter ginsenosidivorans]|uniref:Gfo/Idh/MocA family oxidoreductase n=1 Tax=Panacibacter ginsenosidivorans TaxID=1813871 RepID=A0A5B8VEP0_9BACT|nr:Gfo/Idh/MocA family oxidoreductase [Panacibacter ginsenosidivorans]QEC69880.1 Gfo/Idh/MocA family oxidoreductase [Panacibacter ginsenosidivorans]
MKKDILQNVATDVPEKNNAMNRRKFVELASSAALAFTIVPRHVLGGKNYVAPSDKITLAYIGVGTQGIRELLPMLAVPEIQVVAVCDPNKEARGYRDWGINYLRGEIRKTIQKPDWDCGGDGLIPGGRDNGKSIVDTYYTNVQKQQNYKGCTAYEDVRELLDKEKDLDAVKIMTPDHLHGILCMAAIKRGKHVLVHKPISNRLAEGKKVIEMARNNPKVITHLIPWDSNGSMETVMSWINAGAIGTLKEVHNWTNRPVWPQYPELPKDKPPVPDGFNWNLWLGPEADRAYSPDYTNMVFRGWYDFGGGSMADMGHYSLWTVFNALKLTSPTVVIPNRSHVCDFNGAVPFRVNNDFSFPMASMVRFKYPANGNRGPVDLCWYDGGMRPPIPSELFDNNKELPEEGMMFVGDNGKILTGFNVQDPKIISGKQMDAPKTNTDQRDQVAQTSAALPLFVNACKTGKQYPGNFSEAEYLTEAVNLYALALRTNKLLKYDAANVRITNVADANKYISRDYRKGWEPENI